MISTILKKVFFVCIVIFCTLSAKAQDSLYYRLDAFGSVATKDITPFWIVNNTYGVVPLQSNNLYGRGDLYWQHRFNKDLRFDTEADIVGATEHSSSLFIQQLYASLSYKSINLTIGTKEYYNSMLSKSLSIGDFDYSPNARPIPEINFSIPKFVTVPYTKGILFVRGDFAVGKSTDDNYIIRTKYDGEDYNTDLLWHHKSLFFLLKDPKQHFPLSLMLGIEHAVQWGGWVSLDNIGELPHSFSDFIRVVLGESGGSDSPQGDQTNALGNSQGTFNVKFGYHSANFELEAYKQHFFDDKSGIEYANWRDGIWGLECSLHTQPYVKKIVLEYLNTTNQSGTIHMLPYDPARNARGGGSDDYYNHDYYITGWSHWGRALGNPLITNPEYSKQGKIYFQNNRVKAIHLGFEGEITPTLTYRVLGTGMYAWGRMNFPFLERKNDFSALFECNYSYPKWKGWKFGLQMALDNGDLYENNFGASLKISKSGIILP